MSDVEIVARVKRRRKWTIEEKAALIAEVRAEGGEVRLVARRHRVSESLLYNGVRHGRLRRLPQLVRRKRWSSCRWGYLAKRATERGRCCRHQRHHDRGSLKAERERPRSPCLRIPTKPAIDSDRNQPPVPIEASRGGGSGLRAATFGSGASRLVKSGGFRGAQFAQ